MVKNVDILKRKRSTEDDFIDLIAQYIHRKSPKLLFSVLVCDTLEYFDVDFAFMHEKGNFRLLYEGIAHFLARFIIDGHITLEETEEIWYILKNILKKGS